MGRGSPQVTDDGGGKLGDHHPVADVADERKHAVDPLIYGRGCTPGEQANPQIHWIFTEIGPVCYGRVMRDRQL
jgi:hypothetical protein